jgi:hypothetical protein
MANTLNTRILLKSGTLAEWQAGRFNSEAADAPRLKKGELAVVFIPNTTEGSTLEPVMFKVGNGVDRFDDLDWASGKAADVYGWAKAANKPTYTADEIQGLEDFIAGEIQDSNTTYTFEIVDGKLVIKAKDINTDAVEVATIDFVTPEEFEAATAGKLHTQAEIETIAANKINALIDAADNNEEVITNIGNLVEYIAENASDIAQLVTDVATANTNASTAVETANTANATAGAANTTAGEAKTLAEEAKEAAVTAQNSASANAAAADASAKAAATSADEAAASANAAAKSAEDAEAAKGIAVTAGNNAAQAETNAKAAKEAALGA